MFKFLLLFLLFFQTNTFATNTNIKDKINDYLLNLKTISAEFTQYINDEKESATYGKFVISRPNKLRFEYTKPFKSLLINNDNVVYYYDIELDELTTLPSQKTPLSFLLSDNKNLEDLNFEIIDFYNKNNQVYIKTKNNDIKEVEKQNIILVFDKNIATLQGIILEDNNGNLLQLKFNKIQQNKKIDNKLFIFNKNKRNNINEKF